MGRVTTHDDITLNQRYECKYRVSPLLVPSIRQFIRPFLRPDPHAVSRPGGRYPISSLYLDSDDLRLYQQTVGGEKNRFKLRVRTYSDDPADPVFLEVKSKINSIVRKRRARLDRARAVSLLAGSPQETLGVPEEEHDDVAFFRNRVALLAAKPVMRVAYVREAYESSSGDPIRVTLDTNLAHAVTLDFDLSHDRGRWISTPVQDVIVELKFTDTFPGWMHEFVRVFGLKQQAVPKYVLSMDHALLGARESSLAMAGFTLPPRRA